jgi:hypothetical protein
MDLLLVLKVVWALLKLFILKFRIRGPMPQTTAVRWTGVFWGSRKSSGDRH